MEVTKGPYNIADRPTPVGCDELPVTDGIFSADNTNINAPANASVIFSRTLPLETD